MFAKAISFALVGIVNTVIDASVFFLALAFLTSSLVAANVLAWYVAVSCSYVMNSYITFAVESGRRLRFNDYGRFVASGILAVVANTATLVIAAQYLPVWAAKALAIGVSFLVNFSMSHFVVFPVRRTTEPASSDERRPAGNGPTDRASFEARLRRAPNKKQIDI